jgi:hypothetical protein
MPLPHDVLTRLSNLSGYDQMLEMDNVSREHGISLSQIESELAAFAAGVQPTIAVNPIDDFVPGAYKDEIDLTMAEPAPSGPKYIDSPDQYRMKYDPSVQGMNRQAQVNQAIICPSCSSPLGIPDVRPIKVTCPQCMHEAVFQH